MRKGSKAVVFVGILSILLFGLSLSYPVFADDGGVVRTNLFGNVQDDGAGCGVFTILNLVVDVLSMGVGILGVIGIVVVGINYLSAKGSPEQVERSKKRLLAIVIGLVAYALLYSGVQWLMPGGKLNTAEKCTTISDEEYKKVEEAKNNSGSGSNDGSNADNKSSSSSSSSSKKTKKTDYKKSKAYKNCIKKAAKVVKDAGICEKETAAQRVLATAKLLAWPKGTSSKKYSYDTGSATKAFKSALDDAFPSRSHWNTQQIRDGASCLIFTATVVRSSGVDRKYVSDTKQFKYKSDKFKRITCSNCDPYKKSKAGDVVLYWVNEKTGNGHATIRGKNVIYEAQLHGRTYGHTSSATKLKGKKEKVIILRPID